jgi:toxin ParE1/3/4
MMPRLIVHDIVMDDVDAIARHIARDNLPAALGFYDAAQAAFDLLSSMPGAGPRVEPPLAAVPGLRFWPVRRYRNYLVLYRPLPDGAEIIRVIHGAQEIPSLFGRG